MNSGYTRSVRSNLATMMTYAENVDGYSGRHAPQIREALHEATSLAGKLGMSFAQTSLVTVAGMFSPMFARYKSGNPSPSTSPSAMAVVGSR